MVSIGKGEVMTFRLSPSKAPTAVPTPNPTPRPTPAADAAVIEVEDVQVVIHFLSDGSLDSNPEITDDQKSVSLAQTVQKLLLLGKVQ